MPFQVLYSEMKRNHPYQCSPDSISNYDTRDAKHDSEISALLAKWNFMRNMHKQLKSDAEWRYNSIQIDEAFI